MPLVYTMTGTLIDERLVDHAAAATPNYWSANKRAREDLYGAAAALRAADAQVATGERLALVDTSQGSWLDLIGKDRAILRRGDEPDTSYQVRLKSVEDKATPSAVLAAVNLGLTVADIAEPTPSELASYPLTYPSETTSSAYLVEIVRDACFCDVGFCDSERPMGPGPTLVAVLPPDASESTAQAAYEAIRKTKAATVYVLVFPSVTGGQP